MMALMRWMILSCFIASAILAQLSLDWLSLLTGTQRLVASLRQRSAVHAIVFCR